MKATFARGAHKFVHGFLNWKLQFREDTLNATVVSDEVSGKWPELLFVMHVI